MSRPGVARRRTLDVLLEACMVVAVLAAVAWAVDEMVQGAMQISTRPHFAEPKDG